MPSRILSWVGAADATARDVDILTNMHLQKVELDAGLKARVLSASGGSLRYVATSLDLLAEFAAIKGLARITEADWGGRHLHTGEAPIPRHTAPRAATMRRAGRAA